VGRYPHSRFRTRRGYEASRAGRCPPGDGATGSLGPRQRGRPRRCPDAAARARGDRAAAAGGRAARPARRGPARAAAAAAPPLEVWRGTGAAARSRTGGRARARARRRPPGARPHARAVRAGERGEARRALALRAARRPRIERTGARGPPALQRGGARYRAARSPARAGDRRPRVRRNRVDARGGAPDGLADLGCVRALLLANRPARGAGRRRARGPRDHRPAREPARGRQLVLHEATAEAPARGVPAAAGGLRGPRRAGKLASIVASTPASAQTYPVEQVPQWLFAFDAAGMAAFRALALLDATARWGSVRGPRSPLPISRRRRSSRCSARRCSSRCGCGPPRLPCCATPPRTPSGRTARCAAAPAS